MKKTFVALISLLSVFEAFSQTSPAKPKLIVHIIIEQMNYEYISNFSTTYGGKGFNLLVSSGAVCTNAQIPYSFIESSPAYASISTGATPSAHGIIGNSWFNSVTNTREYAVADKQYFCVGCSKSDRFQVSPENMFAQTFSDQLIKHTHGKSKSFSIALQPHAAILMSGRLTNGTFWLDDITGNWVTSTYYSQLIPSWLHNFNSKRFADLYMKKTWDTYLPISKYTQSLDDNTNFEIGIQNQTTFPYKLKKLKDNYKPYKILNQTPFGNSLTKDLAIELIDSENLGQDEFTDYLAISFTAPEEIGNTFGSMSKEIQDCYVRLDFEIGFLIEYLEKTIGKENFLLVVQSNHGVETPIKYEYNAKMPEGIFKYVEAMYILDKYLDATYGEGDWIQYYFAQQVYLNHNLISKMNLPLEQIQNTCALFLMQLKGVHTVLTASALQKNAFTKEEYKRIDLSYNQIRSGDLHIVLLPGWSQQSVNVVGQHISPFPEVTHIPLIWYGWNIRSQNINTYISTSDIVPTFCEIVGIPRPNMAHGNLISALLP